MVFDANDHKEFFHDVTENGFHIFSRRHASNAGFYPSALPAYPDLQIADINVGDTITIRAFFPASKAARPRIDSGHIALEVEYVDADRKNVWGNIITELPATFALAKGTSIELSLDEVLFVNVC